MRISPSKTESIHCEAVQAYNSALGRSSQEEWESRGLEQTTDCADFTSFTDAAGLSNHERLRIQRLIVKDLTQGNAGVIQELIGGVPCPWFRPRQSNQGKTDGTTVPFIPPLYSYSGEGETGRLAH